MEAFLGGLVGGLIGWIVAGTAVTGWLLWHTRHAVDQPDDEPAPPPHYGSLRTPAEPEPAPQPAPPPPRARGRAT